jgi:hypothetical protein
MPKTMITGQGLCSIALLTATLWGCIFLERLTVAHAREEASRALEQIRALQLKKRAIPAASPAFGRQSTRPAVG